MTDHRMRTALAVAAVAGLLAAGAAVAWTMARQGDATVPTGVGTGVTTHSAPQGTTLTSLATGQPASRAVAGTPCATTMERVYDLVAESPTTCAKAEAVALAYDRAVMAGTAVDGMRTADGYDCQVVWVSPPENETTEVACAGPQGKAGFIWGV